MSDSCLVNLFCSGNFSVSSFSINSCGSNDFDFDMFLPSYALVSFYSAPLPKEKSFTSCFWALSTFDLRFCLPEVKTASSSIFCKLSMLPQLGRLPGCGSSSKLWKPIGLYIAWPICLTSYSSKGLTELCGSITSWAIFSSILSVFLTFRLSSNFLFICYIFCFSPSSSIFEASSIFSNSWIFGFYAICSSLNYFWADFWLLASFSSFGPSFSLSLFFVTLLWSPSSFSYFD